MEQSKYTYSIEETGAGGISAYSRATKRWQRKWFVDRACAEPAQIIEKNGKDGKGHVRDEGNPLHSMAKSELPLTTAGVEKLCAECEDYIVQIDTHGYCPLHYLFQNPDLSVPTVKVILRQSKSVEALSLANPKQGDITPMSILLDSMGIHGYTKWFSMVQLVNASAPEDMFISAGPHLVNSSHRVVGKFPEVKRTTQKIECRNSSGYEVPIRSIRNVGRDDYRPLSTKRLLKKERDLNRDIFSDSDSDDD